MAAKGKDKKKVTEKAAKKPRNLHERYEVAGDSIKRKNKTCPKCGPGKFLGQHKNRTVCGKCGYTEFASKKEEASA